MKGRLALSLAALFAAAGCFERAVDDAEQRADHAVLRQISDAAENLGTQHASLNKALAREAAEHAEWLGQNLPAAPPSEYLETLVLSVRLLDRANEIAIDETEAAGAILLNVVDDLRIKRSDAVQNGRARLVPIEVEVQDEETATADWQILWAWQPGLELEGEVDTQPVLAPRTAARPTELPPGVYVFSAQREQDGESFSTERTVAPVVSQGDQPAQIQLLAPVRRTEEAP